MIDKKNRLKKLAQRSGTFGQFVEVASRNAARYLRPYVQQGAVVTVAWMIEFWKANKEDLI